MHFWGNFGSIIKPYLIFEPAYVLFNIAVFISDLADTNLYLQKSCRFNVTSEPDIRTPCDDEPAGIEFVANINSKYVFGLSFITVLITVLMSAWTDKALQRRKLCILFPMVLKAGQLFGMCLHSYFWYWPALYAIFTENILITSVCMRVASIVYICCVSSSEDRTFRLTLLYVLQTVTNIISSGSSGYLLRNIGFLNTYILCTVLTISAIIYLQIFVEDVPAESKSGFCKYIRDFFDVRSLVQAFKLVFRKREGNARAMISLLAVINNLAWLTYIGETSVLYLYLRFKFGWNEQDYGLYILYKMVGISIGSVICIALNKNLKINDSALATFAAFWDVLASLGYFFAVTNWQLYLIPILDIFHGFALNVCDSLQSRFFESHEFGRLFSVHITLNVAIPFAFPAYNLLFKSTMDHQPGSVFLLSSSINFIVCILYGIGFMLMKNNPKKEEEKSETSVLYLYLRFKFGWNEQDYGLYILYKMIGISIGSVICIGLNKILKINDSALATFAAFWDVLASLGYFFAITNWQLYLSRLFSVHSTLNMAVLFAFPAYNFLFESTKNHQPGLVFLLSSSINLIICILYGIGYMLMKNNPKEEEEKN